MEVQKIIDAELIDSAVADVVEDFSESLNRNYDSDELLRIRTVGAFIMQGLNLDEACILSRMAPSRLKTLIENDTAVAAFITIKRTAFKASLLRVVVGKVIEGQNDKNATYLLEKLYPREFNTKTVDPFEEKDDNLIQRGLSYIRENGDARPVVTQKTLPESTTGSTERGPSLV